MIEYLKHEAWSIVEEGFHREYSQISESIFSLGNGRMGQRANFEEHFSGHTLLGNYVAGVYYPDKTRVGWWKNGYPQYFAKVLNAANWVGIDVEVKGEQLDLHFCEVEDFRRELNMKEGYLERSFTATMRNGVQLQVVARRFCSMANDEVGAIRYAVRPMNYSGKVIVTSYIDADVKNQDANYDEKFWNEIATSVEGNKGHVLVETKKTAFQVCTGMKVAYTLDGDNVKPDIETVQKEKYIAVRAELNVDAKSEFVVYKYAANLASTNYPKEELVQKCQLRVKEAAQKGFKKLFHEHKSAWASKWKESDIIINGDVSAQQGIRFNIFQLNQTYTGEDARLNIGPKGFTGEKYGGSTYWDTEAYCIPFYLATADQHVARNLLVYRYKHLQKAIENAALLGFSNGAALYPMVTMTGEECHNEWEITFEEIHRNGAIAYAIHDYVRYTGDAGYLADHGLEVLLGIARFWQQRIHFSQDKQQYVMLGVTGPNEYENNVNNNWYTNYISNWCMKYAMYALDYVKENAPERFAEIMAATNFSEEEREKWQHIIDNMYFPKNEELGVFLQQDGFLDKEYLPVKQLDKKHLPLNQKWSWDRILRSCYIKQADVLQGLYFFEEHFDTETIRRHFDYYEPITVHESSLSPCVHSILAAKIGREEKAYEMYLRTARLDIDSYNNDTEDGLHITSMAGTWMAVVKGFGGMRVNDGVLELNPFIPQQWESYSFKVRFKGALLQVKVGQQSTEVANLSETPVEILLKGTRHRLEAVDSVLS
jgi:maltose phosphorylase